MMTHVPGWSSGSVYFGTTAKKSLENSPDYLTRKEEENNSKLSQDRKQYSEQEGALSDRERSLLLKAKGNKALASYNALSQALNTKIKKREEHKKYIDRLITMFHNLAQHYKFYPNSNLLDNRDNHFKKQLSEKLDKMTIKWRKLPLLLVRSLFLEPVPKLTEEIRPIIMHKPKKKRPFTINLKTTQKKNLANNKNASQKKAVASGSNSSSSNIFDNNSKSREFQSSNSRKYSFTINDNTRIKNDCPTINFGTSWSESTIPSTLNALSEQHMWDILLPGKLIEKESKLFSQVDLDKLRNLSNSDGLVSLLDIVNCTQGISESCKKQARHLGFLTTKEIEEFENPGRGGLIDALRHEMPKPSEDRTYLDKTDIIADSEIDASRLPSREKVGFWEIFQAHKGFSEEFKNEFLAQKASSQSSISISPTTVFFERVKDALNNEDGLHLLNACRLSPLRELKLYHDIISDVPANNIKKLETLVKKHNNGNPSGYLGYIDIVRKTKSYDQLNVQQKTEIDTLAKQNGFISIADRWKKEDVGRLAQNLADSLKKYSNEDDKDLIKLYYNGKLRDNKTLLEQLIACGLDDKALINQLTEKGLQ